MTGPGISTFYSVGGTVTLPTTVKAFFVAIAGLFPPSVTLQFPVSGDIIDDADGSLTGGWTNAGSTTQIVGTGGSNFAAGVGMQVRWRTNGIVGHRRVVGSTFLAPASSAHYDTDGTILAVDVTTLQTAANTFVTAEPSLRIWSRPVPAPIPPATTPAPRGGTSSVVVAAQVPDRVSWLRSRRT